MSPRSARTLIQRDTVVDLKELLGFRHFMRHAYAVTLKPARLSELSELLTALYPRRAAELRAFEARLLAEPTEAGEADVTSRR